MAVTHPEAVRNGIADYVVDQLNAGFLVFDTAGDVEVATLTFGNPAFGSAASGIATANSITEDSSATGGTTTKAELQTSGTTAIVLCSVSATSGGGDIELSTNIITASSTVQVTSLTYTAPL